MHQTRGAVYRPAHLRDTATLLRDFDQIEEATEECVRLVQHGHTFDGSIQGIKPAHSKIYSL